MCWSRVSVVLLFPLLFLGTAHRQASAQQYELDSTRSHLYAVTHRAGLLSFLGHDHAILASAFSAELCWNRAAPAATRASVTVESGSLVIDSDEARAVAGLGEGPDSDDVRTIQGKLLDEQNLDAADHPYLYMQIVDLSPANGEEFQARGELTIRDVARDVTFPVRILELEEGAVAFRGSLRVRQSDFGIDPESVAGVVRVSDRVDIHFNLHAVPTGRSCP